MNLIGPSFTSTPSVSFGKYQPPNLERIIYTKLLRLYGNGINTIQKSPVDMMTIIPHYNIEGGFHLLFHSPGVPHGSFLTFAPNAELYNQYHLSNLQHIEGLLDEFIKSLPPTAHQQWWSN